MIASERLTPGEVYTRAQLKELFQITDSTINTGVFRPKGTSSVWLFVTEKKTSDRTPYRDHLEGETLHWQGQTSGRTDPLIIGHEAAGLELLVFFRKQKNEHPGAGFRYLGPFAYVSHSGANPISFVLRAERARQAAIGPDTADDEPFDPSTVSRGWSHSHYAQHCASAWAEGFSRSDASGLRWSMRSHWLLHPRDPGGSAYLPLPRFGHQ